MSLNKNFRFVTKSQTLNNINTRFNKNKFEIPKLIFFSKKNSIKKKKNILKK